MDRLLKWVSLFNKYDEETISGEVDNSHAYGFLKDEIPLLECSDEAVEMTYYFRWWTYRKHLKKTPDGYVITEFLPKVPWSGRYNTINAPIAHHLREGRWLKNSVRYLSDYIKFFLSENQSNRRYSVDFISAIKDVCDVRGELFLGDDFLELACAYYRAWENERQIKNGMFWSYDGRDAMEFSISGTAGMKSVKGLRPTLNSYMYADAYAIAEFADIYGSDKIKNEYTKKAMHLKEMINKTLFHDGFYKAIHPRNENFDLIYEKDMSDVPKELIGYIPWCYKIPEKKYGKCFDLLADEKCFLAKTGLSTADQSDRRFLFEAPHECLWNGYVWPFATSQTLNALRSYIVNYDADEKYREMYADIFCKYALMHRITDENGNVRPWIDEVMHPYRYDWTSRTYLKNAGWPKDKGGYERGKDYNHSTFCDLFITGIAGIVPNAAAPSLIPSIPKDWEYFKLANLHFKGRLYTVYYDKTGKKYNKGTGAFIEVQNAPCAEL